MENKFPISDEELQRLAEWLKSDESREKIREALKKADETCKIIDSIRIDPTLIIDICRNSSSMKIIALDESRPQSYGLYTALDNLFYFLAEYLPKFFLFDVKFNGEVLQIPKVITKMHYDSLDDQTRDLLNELCGDIYFQKI